jgi:hypothetical protein
LPASDGFPGSPRPGFGEYISIQPGQFVFGQECDPASYVRMSVAKLHCQANGCSTIMGNNGMSDCRFTFCIAGSLAVLPFFSLATPLSGHDSVVQIVAEAQGLARVAPADWPETGTFWLMEPSGLTAPAPQPPTDANTPVYRLADGQYLVDSTAGQLLGNARPGQPQSALAAATKQAEAVTNLISQVQGAAWQRARAQQLGIQQGQNPTNLIAGTNAKTALACRNFSK